MRPTGLRSRDQPAQEENKDVQTCRPDAEKRRLIDALESARRVECSAEEAIPAHPTQNPVPGQKTGNVQLHQALRAAQATCKMLEETVESFETKLLDTIAENGRLHESLDQIREELFQARSRIATLTRQRDGLRRQLDDSLNQGTDYVRALSAAEREIFYLHAKYREVRLGDTN